ncbi:MAG: helix-turn-helix transcriptional regulator [Deltaproteobacteria bacterium]|nr:helix-turn-helix transcriptional regulator [Deltaproteobacteria bacterium]
MEHILQDLSLTGRQAEVLRLLATGATNETIAKTLRISLSGVKFHLGRAYRRTGLSRRALLHRLARG